MSARKLSAAKSATKKSAAPKPPHPHPTWADMIKVSLPFIVIKDLRVLYYTIYSARDAIVVVCCNW